MGHCNFNTLVLFPPKPSDSTEFFYNAKIRLSEQAMAEIQTLLEGEDSWINGALDNAISQILVDLRPHNAETLKSSFEDIVGVEFDTVLKVRSFFNLKSLFMCSLKVDLDCS